MDKSTSQIKDVTIVTPLIYNKTKLYIQVTYREIYMHKCLKRYTKFFSAQSDIIDI